jgi:hypothetical protein
MDGIEAIATSAAGMNPILALFGQTELFDKIGVADAGAYRPSWSRGSPR